MDDVAVTVAVGGAAGSCGCNAGSGGGVLVLGNGDVPRGLPMVSVRGNAQSGGVHCVPASLVVLGEDVDDEGRGRL